MDVMLGKAGLDYTCDSKAVMQGLKVR